MTPNYIKHPDMLALTLCTSERYDWTGHICCGYNAHQSEGLSLSQDDAMIDELAAQHIASSADDVF